MDEDDDINEEYRIAIIENEEETIAELLTQDPEFLHTFYNTANEDGEYPIHLAAAAGNLRKLYPDGISRDQVNLPEDNDFEATPLIIAASHLKTEAVEFLIENRANCNLKFADSSLHTALTFMIFSNSLITLTERIPGGGEESILLPISAELKRPMLGIATLLIKNGVDLDQGALIEHLGRTLNALELAQTINFTELANLIGNTALREENKKARMELGYETPVAGESLAAGTAVSNPTAAIVAFGFSPPPPHAR